MGGANGLAVAAMILGVLPVFVGIPGIIMGSIALGQIEANGQTGRGNALIGIIAGSTWLTIGLVGIVLAALSS